MKVNKFIIKFYLEIPKDTPVDKKEQIMMENEILKKELEVYATSVSNLFAKFRVNFYLSVLKKMAVEIDKKITPPTISFKLNNDNYLYVIPQSDKIMLIYGINFSQRTDSSLAKVFLQELEDSKRHVKSWVESKYYPDLSRPPLELNGVETNLKKFSNGFVSFSKIVI